MYGCEAWKLTAAEEKKLDRFQFTCLRRILRIWWPQCIRNDTISQVTGIKKISDEIRRRRWNWIGHVLRKERNDDCMVAMEWQPEGKRKVGRPKTTWRRTVKKECGQKGWSSWSEVRGAAQDRARIRRSIRQQRIRTPQDARRRGAVSNEEMFLDKSEGEMAAIAPAHTVE
ncbi:hypothetical protein ACROYT_G018700 [Oculina patagonica]